MLAYLFWHRPGAGASLETYEAGLAAFHGLLNAQRLDGFQGSLTLRVDSAAWLPGSGQAYEDWYLVRGSEVLDPLNELAVSPDLREAHDRPAHAAAAGAGGLYRLLGGPAGLSARWATWLSKPRGMPYPELYRILTRWTSAPDVSLWRRQMVLSPATEFCILAPEPPPLPDELTPINVRRQEVVRPTAEP